MLWFIVPPTFSHFFIRREHRHQLEGSSVGLEVGIVQHGVVSIEYTYNADVVGNLNHLDTVRAIRIRYFACWKSGDDALLDGTGADGVSPYRLPRSDFDVIFYFFNAGAVHSYKLV